MLKKVPRGDIREGMRFSAPVFFDDGENMLLGEGVPIKKRELAALDRWSISYVLTAGKPLEPGQKVTVNEIEELDEAEEVGELVEEERPEPRLARGMDEPSLDAFQYTSEQILKLPAVLENDRLYAAYTGLVDAIDAIFADVRERREVKTRSIDKIVADLLSVVQSDRVGILGFILGGDIREKELAKSAINTAILAIIIAEHLELPRHRLLQVATGALLHDVGMLRVPVELVNKDAKLDDAEMQAVRTHTVYGYKLIVNEFLYADEVGRAASQHHERWDGEGYPSRLAGASIDVGARIISVADAFEAMVSPKAYRNSMVGYQAMKNLLSDNARRFDPDIIKAIIQSVGIYPVGSIVLMNNSVIARVVEASPSAPLRPKIRVLIDEFACPFTQNEGELIDLQVAKSLFFARAIDPKEYQGAR